MLKCSDYSIKNLRSFRHFLYLPLSYVRYFVENEDPNEHFLITGSSYGTTPSPWYLYLVEG